MRVGFNAFFLGQESTGSGQYTRQLLQALAQLDKGNEYLLFTLEKPGFSKARAEPTAFVLPPAEVLEALLDLAMTGDVEALREQLAGLAQADEKLRPFVAHLQQLAQGFKLNRICELLEAYLL